MSTTDTGETVEIPFTQYIPPNGRKETVHIERPKETADRALALIAKGYRFECEQVAGMVSLTVVDPDDTGDIAIQLVNNGPGVSEAVDKLIADAMKYDGVHS